MFARIRRAADRRDGVTVVEVALVLPILLAIYFALIEFGHAFLTTQLVKTAARQAGRVAIANGSTTADAVAEANRVLSSMINPGAATIYVKDASDFEDGTPPTNYASLTNVEVSDLESRQLFLIRIEVPYNSVSLFPNGFWHTHVHSFTISGQAVMRHE
jgi:Flp pilus assembly protein TadG